MPANCGVSSLLCLRGKRKTHAASHHPWPEQQLACRCPTLILELNARWGRRTLAVPPQSSGAETTGRAHRCVRGRCSGAEGAVRRHPVGRLPRASLSPGAPHTHTPPKAALRGRATQRLTSGNGNSVGARRDGTCCPSLCRQRSRQLHSDPTHRSCQPTRPKGQPRCDRLSGSLRHPAGLQRARDWNPDGQL